MKTIRQLSMLFLLLFVTHIAKAQSFDMPLNFDSTNVTYTLTDFGGNTSSVVADPVVSTNKVAKVIKSNTAAKFISTITYPFAGLGNEAIPQQETIVIKNATVWTNTSDSVLKEHDVYVVDGKIVLEKNDAFVIKTSTSGSLDIVLSVLENAIN